MASCITLCNLPLILLYLHAVFTRDSIKISQAGENHEANAPELSGQNMVFPLQLFSFHSEKSKNLRDMKDCSHRDRILKIVRRGKQGIGFPSLEAALLSLAFLTFAVYLVNLTQVFMKTMQGN